MQEREKTETASQDKTDEGIERGKIEGEKEEGRNQEVARRQASFRIMVETAKSCRHMLLRGYSLPIDGESKRIKRRS